MDNFSKYSWTVPSKNKYAQTKTDQFSQINKRPKRETNVIEIDDFE